MRTLLALILALTACDDGGGAEAPVEAICDADAGRALLAGPFRCADAPDFVAIDDGEAAFDVFTYEASHPTASSTRAFPCAVSRGQPIEAPAETTEACSVAGVRPWHTVRWDDATAACAAIGWRLCTAAELSRACAGPGGRAWTYGAVFEPFACNVRDAYAAEGERLASEAPTGSFTGCVSAEGAFDLTGNLREWTAGGETGADSPARSNQGGGWRTVAEAHREDNLRCDARVTVPAFSAATYASADVGFRCCRDH